jgi:hypothetical protein
MQAATKAHEPKKGFRFEVVGWSGARRQPPARRIKVSGCYDNANPALNPSTPNQIKVHAAASSLAS